MCFKAWVWLVFIFFGCTLETPANKFCDYFNTFIKSLCLLKYVGFKTNLMLLFEQWSKNLVIFSRWVEAHVIQGSLCISSLREGARICRKGYFIFKKARYDAIVVFGEPHADYCRFFLLFSREKIVTGRLTYAGSWQMIPMSHG